MSGATRSVSIWRVAVVLAFCLPPLMTRADEQGETVPSDPVFTALLFDGTTLSGRIRQIGPKDQVTLVPSEGPERVVPLTNLVKLTREGNPVSFSSDLSLILFPDGDRLYRSVIGAATDTTVGVQQYALGNLSIPLESALGIVLTLPSDDDARDAFMIRVRSEPRTSEILWLANGDRVTGGFLGLDEMKIKFQTGNGTLTLDRSGITALGFNPATVNYPRPKDTFLELTLSDGSRLGVTDTRIDQGQVVALTRFGSALRLPISELATVHVQSPAVSYLSEREAFKTHYISYVGSIRPYRSDETVDGHPFRLAGQFYDRGLGTQSRTFLAYRLDPGDRRFQALVGLDDRAGSLGSVVFRVLVDGRERFNSPPMSVSDTPKPIDVDVAGAKTLILVTEFGDRGGVRDFADWVEARLIRIASGASAP